MCPIGSDYADVKHTAKRRERKMKWKKNSLLDCHSCVSRISGWIWVRIVDSNSNWRLYAITLSMTLKVQNAKYLLFSFFIFVSLCVFVYVISCTDNQISPVFHSVRFFFLASFTMLTVCCFFRFNFILGFSCSQNWLEYLFSFLSKCYLLSMASLSNSQWHAKCKKEWIFTLPFFFF